jgi:hypothetical protein
MIGPSDLFHSSASPHFKTFQVYLKKKNLSAVLEQTVAAYLTGVFFMCDDPLQYTNKGRNGGQ